MEAPAQDEIEVSLFGPGYGEAIVLHLGSGIWITIDSCIDPLTASVVPLAYLREIGIDFANQVKFVIATHWHNDHIAGVGALFEACTSARFAMAQALRSEEFIGLALSNQSSDPSPLGKATTEIVSIFRTLHSRGSIPAYLGSDRLLFSGGIANSISVHSLSPDDAVMDAFLRRVAQVYPIARTPQLRLSDLKPNNLSVALLIKVPNGNILLGADLEELPGGAWTRIVKEAQCLEAPATLFKVPHHGSITGHCDAVWSVMLDQNAVAILAPWNRGSKLPQPSDIDRILSLTNTAFATASPQAISPIKRSSTVLKSVDRMGIRLELAQPRPGHVRLRRKITESTWKVEKFGTASDLKHLKDWAAA